MHTKIFYSRLQQKLAVPDTWETFVRSLKSRSDVVLMGPMVKARPPIAKSLPVLFVDGGLKKKAWKKNFDFHVGDGDSSTAQPDWLLPRDKDFSDLAFVLKLLPKHFRKIHAVGFSGGRYDHHIANQFEFCRFAKKLKNGFVVIDENAVFLSPGEWRWKYNGAFSFITLERQHIILSGKCKFKISSANSLTPKSSHGVSNLGFGEMKIKNSLPLMVFLKKGLTEQSEFRSMDFA